MKKAVIYGIGEIGKKYISDCIRLGITELELVDSNSDLQGTNYQGMKIHSPADTAWEEYDLVVITVSENYGTDVEILNRLQTVYHVPEEKIAFWRETMLLSDKEIYNLGNMVPEKKLDAGMIATGRDLAAILRESSLNDLEKFFFFKKHKTVNKWMHYFEAYDRFFSKYRGKDVTILEIGVFKGGSLQMWKDYFKTSDNKVKIYGIDIDPGCRAFEEDGIKIFIGSQEDREFLYRIREEIGKVDILIDDGGHTMNQQIVTFEELFDLVDDNGIYLCEDTHTSYMKYYGGEYRGNTFIEYTKSLIDGLHKQYSETDELEKNIYADNIKFITYCDSMVFIEKKKKTTKSTCVCI